MRLNGKTVYAVEALFDMAFHGDGRAVQARETAVRQAIPPRYLEQILQDLRRAGLIDAKRGPGGGYALARSPAEIRLSEIVAALEARAHDDEAAPRREGNDVPGLVLRDVVARIEAVLADVTLADLVARADALGVVRAPSVAQMYFI